MKNEEYWVKRAELVVLDSEKKAGQLLETLKTAYKNSLSDIDREIEAFFGRYAQDNKLSLVEINKRLNRKELKTFKEQLKRYYDAVDRLTRESNGKVDVRRLRQFKGELRELSAKAYISRLEELKTKLKNVIVELGVTESTHFNDTLSQVYTDSYMAVSYDVDRQQGFSTGLEPKTQEFVQSTVNKNWAESNFSDRIWDNKSKLYEQMNTTFLQGVAQGFNPKKIAALISKKTGTAYSDCERLARTESAHIAGEATYQRYRDIGITRYKFVATLDNRTSEICRQLDGRVFEVREKQVGVNYPPMHPNCRSTTIAWFDDKTNEILFENAERAAKDGSGKIYYVPMSMTYKEWAATVNYAPP